MLTPFEYAYIAASPFLPPLYRRVRRELSRALAPCGPGAAVLDVGGRNSHYTAGAAAAVTITDLPRVTAIQEMLNLGFDDGMQARTRSRRSNVVDVRIDDMTRTALAPSTFDVVLAVEVLEHVEDDALFVASVCRVLKPGGTFIMTTPNGDWVANTNPDHKRHYRRNELSALLERSFGDVTIEYAIRYSRSRNLGLNAWSLRRPLRTVLSMIGNLINTVESGRSHLANAGTGTSHLVAVARKASHNSTLHPVTSHGIS